MAKHWWILAGGAALGYFVLGTNGASQAANIPVVGSLLTQAYNTGFNMNSANSQGGGAQSGQP